MPDINVNFTSGDLSRVNDTNVTLTLGGTPLGALLEDITLTLGWTGTLADSRISSAATWNAKQDAIPLGTPLQLLRTNAAGTAFESVTPSTTIIAEGTNLYYTDARVRATTLTGLSISGSTITSTDTVLSAFGKLQNQVTALVGGVNYQGTWNATTNSPALVSSTGTKGYYYVVSVAGSTNLDGITDWKLGDWVIFNGATWEKVDNTDAVISVNGYSGAVVLVKADIGLGNVENTALSTWAGTTSITTVGTIGSGTWQGSGITETYLSISDVTTNNVSNTAHGFFPKLTANSIYYVNNAGALTALTVGAAGTVLTGNGVTSAPTWAASGSGITVGTTTITSGADNRILFQDATASDFVTQLANFTMGSVATGVLDVPVGYAIGGTRISAIDNTAFSTAWGINTAGTVTISSNYVTLFGNGAGKGTPGANNSAFGARSLGYFSAGVTGTSNDAFGYQSLGSVTSGGSNSTFGQQALASVTTGSFNIGMGSLAGYLHNQSRTITIGYFGVGPTADRQGILGSEHADGYISNWYFNGVTHSAPYAVTLNASGFSGSNGAGAAFKIAGGRATGTGAGGSVVIQTSVKGSAGSTAQTLGDSFFIAGKYVDLTGGAATSFGTITVATSGTVTGGFISYTVEANDGTDFQCLSGSAPFSVINKAGTLTLVLGTDTQSSACSTGTLTGTLTLIASGTTATFQMNAVSSLTETVLRVNFQVMKNFGIGSIAAS